MLFLLILLAGCDRVMHELHELLFPDRSNLVILIDKPLVLVAEPVRFQPANPARTGDKSNIICIVLDEDIPLGTMKKMDAHFKSLMKGVDVNAIARAVDGREIGFGRPNLSWSKYGKILNRDELSACLQLDCNCTVEKNVEIREFTILATDKLPTKGIYWKSSNAPG